MGTAEQIGDAQIVRRANRIIRRTLLIRDEVKRAYYLVGLVDGAHAGGQSYGANGIVDAIAASDDIPVPDPLQSQV